MLISFKKILSLLDESDVCDYSSPKFPMSYMNVLWLEETTAALKRGNIYFGYASKLPDTLPDNDVGLILLNDTSRDFSECLLERILLQETADLDKIYQKISAHIKAAALQYYALEEMLTLLFKDKSIKEILDLSYDFLQNPIIIYSAHEKFDVVVYSSAEDISEESQPRNLMLSDASDRLTLLNTLYIGQNRLETSLAPLLLEDGVAFKDKRRIASWLQTNINDGISGAIVLIEYSKPFDEKDFVYVYILNRIVSNKLRLSEFQNEYYKVQYEQNIQDLISGKSSVTGEKWLSIVNGHKYRNFIVALLNFKNISQQAYNKIKSDISYQFYFCFVVKRGSYAVVLANPKNGDELSAFEKCMVSIAEKNKITGGLSEQFCDIENLRKYYSQAKNAREIGTKFRKNQRIYKFKDLKYYILLNNVSKAVNLDIFLSNDFQRLKQYDKAKGTEFCKTLHCYIANNANRQTTCHQLNIHRNTLPQRLERIESILGHTITENEFFLMCFFLIL